MYHPSSPRCPRCEQRGLAVSAGAVRSPHRGVYAGDLLHGRLERRPTKSDFLYIMTHFEENLSSLRSQGITLSYYGTVLQARASERDTWLALPVCHAKWHSSPIKPR